jgi:hypothetical protein
MELSELLDTSKPYSAAGETSDDKLRREARLLMAGIAGFCEAAERSVAPEHLLETAGKVALGIGMGAGIAYLSKGRSLLRTGVGIFGAAAGVSFASDVLLNGKSIYGAVTDTWQSGTNWERNVATMKSSVGQFGFDTALMTAAGITGGALERQLSTKLSGRVGMVEPPAVQQPAVRDSRYPLGFKPGQPICEPMPTATIKHGLTIEVPASDSAVAQLTTQYGKQGIVVIETLSANPLKGTGFFVGKDGSIATCFHVVKSAGGVGGKLRVNVDGTYFTARIKGIDAANDLALLQAEGIAAKDIRPLPVAKGTVALQTETVTLGFGGANTLVVSPGVVETVAFKFPSPFPKGMDGNPAANFVKLAAHVRPGSSGAPVFNALTGDVVGLHCASNQRCMAFARPASHLLELMAKPVVVKPGS